MKHTVRILFLLLALLLSLTVLVGCEMLGFSGNSSGVAMKYKLLAFEQMTKIKERYFSEGLRIRLGLIANALSVLGYSVPDVSDIRIVFTHNLPENETEIAQTVNLLKDIVPQDKLIKLLPYDISE